MYTEPPILGRPKMILRILSVFTLLEGFAGILAVAFQSYMVPLDQEVLGKVVSQPYIHSPALLYSTAFLNLIFAVMLIFAGTFLWKLKRSGLMLLVCTLLAEVLYFVCISGVTMYLHRSSNEASRELSKTIAALTGVGNFFLGLQLLTAFPIVAGILIFFAYRYLGIPPRAVN
jgi:hypothetical protein